MQDDGLPRGYCSIKFTEWIISLLNEVYVKLDIDPVTLEELREDYKEWGADVDTQTQQTTKETKDGKKDKGSCSNS